MQAKASFAKFGRAPEPFFGSEVFLDEPRPGLALRVFAAESFEVPSEFRKARLGLHFEALFAQKNIINKTRANIGDDTAAHLSG